MISGTKVIRIEREDLDATVGMFGGKVYGAISSHGTIGQQHSDDGNPGAALAEEEPEDKKEEVQKEKYRKREAESREYRMVYGIQPVAVSRDDHHHNGPDIGATDDAADQPSSGAILSLAQCSFSMILLT